MPSDNPIGEPFFELSEVESSNNYAMQKVQAHLAVHGTTWFAHFQKAGKGQRGKEWKAEPSQNIMLSCVVEPALLSVDNQFLLNAAVALACHDFFKLYAVDKTSIKWPNDIYWEDRKAGGVLIENVLSGERWRYSIIGIGININQTLFPVGVRNPVSLKQITGKTYDIIKLAKELCISLETRWQQLLLLPASHLLKEYSVHLYKLNQSANFEKNGNFFSGIIRGVTKTGELLISQDNHAATSYSTVNWVLP
ncbi:biotin--[acetyl-CoA-carboxylase] ligase [Segetibacter aerophilus]|uniref:Biotin--[acetyl-CoA-carboxylase] ligase n=1 Tax=Segetibacter aerophilus TaxID=670293 RepID=A0A512BJ01_9BACT|nr:biotin--[acetyl-CoA-carboxylase] ligase [Segetibacter aerophilus]GEO11952.1 biotin--[acetyl-CoA-carboxylase] ligase [Segetibacter aerophilus]